jgi:predicted AAA+ superfamily ATPase
MRFLANSLLLRLVEPLEIRLKKKRGAPKICLVDHGLRASWLQEIVPLDPAALESVPHLQDLAGRIAESVVGATLATINGLDLAHFPQRFDEPEVDFVLTVGTLRIPLEVKYRRRIDALADTEGLRTFLEKSVYNAPFALLVTQSDEVHVDDPRIVCLPLSSLMLLR